MSTPTPFTTMVNADTGQVWVVTVGGSGEEESVTWLFPLKQTAVVGDADGNEAEIINGGLRLARFDGLPQRGSDATGQDAYAALIVTARRCSHLRYSIGLNGATLSCNGGTAPHFDLPASSSDTFNDLDIPAGASISAKNLTAGQNYTNLYVSVW